MGPKRMPKQTSCPNPLFVMWLEEWRREAEEKDLNLKFTYAKAIKSIKQYPLPLRSGKEATILKNIGDVIAKKLDARKKEFLENGGDPADLHAMPDDVDQAAPPKRKKKQTRTDSSTPIEPKSPKPCVRKYIPKYRSGPYALLITLYEESQKNGIESFLKKDELQQRAQALCDKSMTIPDAGSHYTAWSSMGTLIQKGFVKRFSNPSNYSITTSGCELAKTLLDGLTQFSPNNSASNTSMFESFLSPPPQQKQNHSNNAKPYNIPTMQRVGNTETRPSNHKTISNYSETNLSETQHSGKQHPGTLTSNGILHSGLQHSVIENHAVNSTSSTFVRNTWKGSGHQLGGRRDSNRMDFYDRLQGKIKNTHISSSISLSSSIESTVGASSSDLQQTSPAILCYWYVGEDGSFSTLKSKALVNINNTGLSFLIKARKKDLDIHCVKYDIDSKRNQDGEFIYAYISDSCCEDVAMAPISSTQGKESCGSLKKINTTPSMSTSSTTTSSRSTSSTTTSSRPSSSTTSSSRPSSSTATSRSASSMIKTTTSKTASSRTSISTITSKTVPYNSNAITIPTKECISTSSGYQPILNNKINSYQQPTSGKQTDSKQTTVLNATSPPEILFTLQPGTFDVYLCVDVVETAGGVGRKKELADKLTKSGIKMDVRKLKVGDFIWIAKEKFGQQREVVLDFIIERKRMDDLASSITDSRFREQKFRMNASGLKKKFYLIEKFASSRHYSVSEETLQQAIMNVNVIEKFGLKETNDIYDSAKYLVVMTTQLTNLYKSKTIHAVAMGTYKQLKNERDFKDIIKENEQHCFTFEEFHDCMDKNKLLTVQEMFCKHLMQLRGVTFYKAEAVTSRYPTPSILVDALAECGTTAEKENLLSSIEFGKPKRKVGPAASKQIVLAYTDGR